MLPDIRDRRKPVTDFLAVKRKEISDRLAELKPQVDEYNRLEAAAKVLAGIPGSAAATIAAPANGRRRGPGRPRGSGSQAATPAAPANGRRRGPGRPRGSGSKVVTPAAPPKAAVSKPGRLAKKARGGRRKGSGNRAAQTLALVQGNPGITIPQLAEKMAIKQNYLYRVLPGLENEKKVQKKGRGWYPVASAA
jgi:hypothetical protein